MSPNAVINWDVVVIVMNWEAVVDWTDQDRAHSDGQPRRIQWPRHDWG